MELTTARWGKGTPALFLHGFTGSADSFSHLAPLLGDGVEAHAVELPGHGQAPLPLRAGPEGFEETVTALGALLTQPMAVVGYSQGARLALALAVRFPSRVTRLVLESGSPGLQRRHDRVRRRAEDEARAALLEREGLEPFLAGWETLPFFEGLRRLPAAQREALARRRRAHRAQGLAAALRALGTGAQPSHWDALSSLRVPTLLLSGARDVKFTRTARRMAHELPLAWRVAFPGVFHVPHLEAPQDYAREVAAFLAAPWTEQHVSFEEHHP